MGNARLLGTVALLALSACATVTVRKVGPDGVPTGPSGIRFYRNRPYVVVNEPFVVGAKPYIVGGAVSVDGRYLLLDDLDLDKECREALGLASAYRQKKPAAVDATRVVVGVVPKGADGGSPAGGPQAQPGSTAPGASSTSGENKDATPVSPVIEEQAGVLNLKATNDNSAFAITKLKRYFDVVYLPDFDEDYVVQGSAGIGNSSVNVALGQSWSFQGIDATEDNGPLARRFLDLLDHGASLLTSLSPAAQAAVPSVLSGTPAAGGPQAGVMTLKEGLLLGEFKAGTPVSVKVTLVRIVAPGLYKILKPKELELVSMTMGPDCRFCDGTSNLDVFACKYGDRLLLPVPPFTDVAFNTYTVAVIEAARPLGDSALQPATPSGPAPGAPQGAFRTGAPPVPQQPPLSGKPEGDIGSAPPPPAGPVIDDAKLRAVEGAINARLLRCRAGTGPYWMARISVTPAGLVVALEAVGAAACAPSIDGPTAAEIARQEVMAAGLGAAVVTGP